MVSKRPAVEVILAQPRGFCAGVDRAINILEAVVVKYGSTRDVYVLHEIVHNAYVVESYKCRNVQFVSRLEDVPDNGLVVFSAHGVSSKVREVAKEKNLFVIDATCPLVTKVHLEIKKYASHGKRIVLIGHAGHREVEGSMGQVTDEVILVSSVEDVYKLEIDDDPHRPVAYVTQTTLSVDDTEKIVQALKSRFPNMVGPASSDICYATQNRQKTIATLADMVDVALVIGSKNSSNSTRLFELAKSRNERSYFIGSYREIEFDWFFGARKIGITSGASAPDVLVQEVVDHLGEGLDVKVSAMAGVKENVVFKLPQLVDIPESVAR